MRYRARSHECASMILNVRPISTLSLKVAAINICDTKLSNEVSDENGNDQIHRAN